MLINNVFNLSVSLVRLSELVLVIEESERFYRMMDTHRSVAAGIISLSRSMSESTTGNASFHCDRMSDAYELRPMCW